MTGDHGDLSAFISIIRRAVAAEPDNHSLRIDLAELLLEHDPEAAEAECAELAARGANHRTVEVLRARIAAARLRRRTTADGPGRPDAAAGPGAPAPPAPPAPAWPDQPGPPARYGASAPPPSPPTGAAGPPAGPIPIDRGGSADERPVFDVDRPAVRLDDVAGMAEVKHHLEAAFLAPLRNPELARLYGQAAHGSLLMYGPPGCGKTYLARAIAGELGANFIHVTVADIMGQYWGQSEKALHEVFETARRARPCVIFFDEFDAIGGRRASGGSNAQSLRMITSQLLIELDGVEASNDGIYVLAATNRPWDIDPALRRPGRLDRTVLILPPDEPARAAIVAGGLRDRPAGRIDLATVVARTDEFSGADLGHLVDTAVQHAFADAMRTGVPRMIETADLLRAAGGITPSTRAWFEQVKPVLEFGVDDGTFAQLRSYLRRHRT